MTLPEQTNSQLSDDLVLAALALAGIAARWEYAPLMMFGDEIYGPGPERGEFRDTPQAAAELGAFFAHNITPRGSGPDDPKGWFVIVRRTVGPWEVM